LYLLKFNPTMNSELDTLLDERYDYDKILKNCKTINDVKKEFRRQAMKSHPDKGFNEQLFKKLVNARDQRIKEVSNNSQSENDQEESGGDINDEMFGETEEIHNPPFCRYKSSFTLTNIQKEQIKRYQESQLCLWEVEFTDLKGNTKIESFLDTGILIGSGMPPDSECPYCPDLPLCRYEINSEDISRIHCLVTYQEKTSSSNVPTFKLYCSGSVGTEVDFNDEVVKTRKFDFDQETAKEIKVVSWPIDRGHKIVVPQSAMQGQVSLKINHCVPIDNKVACQ